MIGEKISKESSKEKLILFLNILILIVYNFFICAYYYYINKNHPIWPKIDLRHENNLKKTIILLLKMDIEPLGSVCNF